MTGKQTMSMKLFHKAEIFYRSPAAIKLSCLPREGGFFTGKCVINQKFLASLYKMLLPLTIL